MIKKGDLVTVDPGYCYAKWSKFAMLHPWYALRWAYSHLPYEKETYRVIGVHGTTIVVQGTLCAIEKCNPIYFIENRGVTERKAER